MCDRSFAPRCAASSVAVVSGAHPSAPPRPLFPTLRCADDPQNPIIFYPWSPLLIGIVLIMLIAVDRIVIAHGIEGNSDQHSHDHVSAAFVEMQAVEKANVGKPADPVAAVILHSSETEHLHSKSSSIDSEEAFAPSVDGAKHSHSHSRSTAVQIVPADAAAHEGHSHVKDPKHHAAHKEALLRAWVFFFALSLHAVFDGLSLGSETTFEGFYGILVAVISHKVFDGIALGIPVYLAEMSTAQSLFALIFCAAMTPLGVAIGLGATASVSEHEGKLAEAIIISLSAGSFLFISLVELLPSSLHDGRFVKTKMFCFFLGWLAMVILAAYV